MRQVLLSLAGVGILWLALGCGYSTNKAAQPPASVSVALVATIGPAQAPGSVSFYDGTTLLGTETVSQGTAALTVEVGVGQHSFVADFFSADPADYTNSTSQVVSYIAAAADPPKLILFRFSGASRDAT